MCHAVLTDRTQQVVTKFATSGAADHEQIRIDGCIDEHVLGLTLDYRRVHIDAGSGRFDRHIDVVARSGAETELIDAESTLGGEHRHDRRDVERPEGGDLGAATLGVSDRPSQGTGRRLRPIDTNDPAICHVTEYRPSPTWLQRSNDPQRRSTVTLDGDIGR